MESKLKLNIESKSLENFIKKIDELNLKLEKSINLIHQLNKSYNELRKNILWYCIVQQLLPRFVFSIFWNKNI